MNGCAGHLTSPTSGGGHGDLAYPAWASNEDWPPLDGPGIGPHGFFYKRRTGDEWQEKTRLDLPYGWGATVGPDGRFLFVNAGDLQTVSLSTLGIEW